MHQVLIRKSAIDALTLDGLLLRGDVVVRVFAGGAATVPSFVFVGRPIASTSSAKFARVHERLDFARRHFQRLVLQIIERCEVLMKRCKNLKRSARMPVE